jgi:hypothetical protein
MKSEANCCKIHNPDATKQVFEFGLLTRRITALF